MPRSVRRAVHPVRTAKYAVTPRPIKKARGQIRTVTNPLSTLAYRLTTPKKRRIK